MKIKPLPVWMSAHQHSIILVACRVTHFARNGGPLHSEWWPTSLGTVAHFARNGGPLGSESVAHLDRNTQIQNVISVGMLSEGWDAKTVTHIMGLRAFSSQLLCEQVVGRGLRRTTYDVNPDTGLFEPEYVNIFGVPFTFLPHEGGHDNPPPPPKPKIAIEPVSDREVFEISWPNVIRVEHTLRPELSVNWEKLGPLNLDVTKITKIAELAPIVEGKPDITKIKSIDLERLTRGTRMQRIVFEAARDVYDQVQPSWEAGKVALLAQLVHLAEKFIAQSDRIRIIPHSLGPLSDSYRKIIITLSMARVAQHILDAVHFQNTKKLDLVLDQDQPIRSTGDMSTWYTCKPCELTKRSHINYCVCDSTWEASDSSILDASPTCCSNIILDIVDFV